MVEPGQLCYGRARIKTGPAVWRTRCVLRAQIDQERVNGRGWLASYRAILLHPSIFWIQTTIWVHVGDPLSQNTCERTSMLPGVDLPGIRLHHPLSDDV